MFRSGEAKQRRFRPENKTRLNRAHRSCRTRESSLTACTCDRKCIWCRISVRGAGLDEETESSTAATALWVIAAVLGARLLVQILGWKVYEGNWHSTTVDLGSMTRNEWKRYLSTKNV